MIVVVFCSFIAIFLTFLESKGVLKKGMLWGFIIITTLGCIHYNYGNDYIGYMRWFRENSRIDFSIGDLFGSAFDWEPGWVILNHIFKDLGFFYLVAFLNIVMNSVYYYIIYKYVEKSWWVLAISIYVLDYPLYVLNFSMMRQGLAISLFLSAWPFIKDGKIIKSLLLILLAASFHKTALILIPFSIIGKFKFREGRIAAIILGFFLIVLYLSATLASDLFQAFVEWDYFFAQDSYDYYMSNDQLEIKYGIGFIINLIPFILGFILLLQKENKPNTNLLIVFCMISHIIVSFCSVLPLLVRVSYYLVAYQVLAIPKMYSMITNKGIRYCLLALLSFMLLYGYYGFFNSPIYAKPYAEFHTIFEAL